MRPERAGGGGVAADLMASSGGSGARPSLWHTPTPYLFLGFAFMMGLIAVALLVLICTRRKLSPLSRRGGVVGGDDEAASSVRVLVPLDREPKVVVIMAGDHAPSFLASAKPLVTFVPTTGGGGGGGQADDGAA